MKLYTVALCGLLSLSISAQDLSQLESLMVPLQHLIANAPTDEERTAASQAFREKLLQILASPEAFDYPFANLAKLGKLTSPDGTFRLISWNVPHTDGTYRYHCFVLYPGTKGYTELVDAATLQRSDEMRTYTSSDWYGALYYHIQPVVEKKSTYYILLGWDGNNKTTNQKLIDAMVVAKDGSITFGKPVFASENGIRHRRVFEYAKEVQMTLTYLPEKEAFVFDDLQPRVGYAVGNYAYYGPSEQHHAYRLVKGIWELEYNTDMRRPKSAESGAQFNFPERPNLNRKRESTNPLQGR
jgi:hypothetical protein